MSKLPYWSIRVFDELKKNMYQNFAKLVLDLYFIKKTFRRSGDDAINISGLLV